jgi:ABC-type transport system involved in multi-copper enzyme maturation permease subunit
MQAIGVIARNSFREYLRDKILYNLLFFAVLLIGGSVLLGTLTIAEQKKIVTDMGLAAINFIGVIISIFLGVGLVSKEIERRTIYTILAKPITRVEFLLGKYLGLASIIAVNVVIMFTMFIATLWLSGSSVHGALGEAVALILIEALLVTAIAVFFSTFSSSILSATITIGLYVIGHLTGDLRGIAEKSQNQMIEAVMTMLYYLCPNLELLNVKGQAASGEFVGSMYLITASAYGFLYAGLLLTGACIIFQRRDF